MRVVKPSEKILTKMLGIIKKRPGIRPREINRLLGRGHSASLRNTLIQQGLVRKDKRGNGECDTIL